MKLVLSIILIVLSIAGIADAGYITYEKLQGLVPACGSGFACGEVLESKWAYIGPIPLSIYGLVYYVTVLLLASANLLELDIAPLTKKLPWANRWRKPLDILRPLTIFGFGFSLYLVFLMGVVIKGWCLYCLLSAATSTSLFLVTWILSALAKGDHVGE